MQQTVGREHAFLGTCRLLGCLRNAQLIQRAPHRRGDAVKPSYGDDRSQPQPLDSALVRKAVSYCQTANYRFAHGLMTPRKQ